MTDLFHEFFTNLYEILTNAGQEPAPFKFIKIEIINMIRRPSLNLECMARDFAQRGVVANPH